MTDEVKPDEAKPKLKRKPIVLNQSTLKDFINCQRLFGWRQIGQLEPIGKRSALEIGTAVHEGLAMLHAGMSVDDARKAAMDKITASAGPLKTFADKSLEEAGDIVSTVFTAYYEHWKGKGEMWRPLNQEIQFMVEVVEGSGVWLRGRADNLSIASGGLYLVDYKTAAKMDPRDLLKYEIDMQLSAYIYGLSKFLTAQAAEEGNPQEIRIQGAIIDVLVKTKIPQFARELFTRTDEELDEFAAEFVEYGNRIRDQFARVEAGENWKSVFPRNTEHCFRYGTCPFRDVCAADTPARRALYNPRNPNYVDLAQAELEAYQEDEERNG